MEGDYGLGGMEGDYGLGGMQGDGVFQTLEYRKSGFASALDASKHLDEALNKYSDWIITSPTVQRHGTGWEVHFNGYKREP